MTTIKTLADILAMPVTKRPDVLLWLDDHRGIYIPRDFAQSFVDRDSCVREVTAEQWADLDAGPDGGLDSVGAGSESYWDTWATVCDNAIVTMDGVEYRLNQDGALWLVPVLMEYDEESDSYIWERPEPDDESSDPEPLPNESGFPDQFGIGDNLGRSDDFEEPEDRG